MSPDDAMQARYDAFDDAVRGGMCERCAGNGEIVTDWERYMRGPLDKNGEDAVKPCPDCDGTGSIELDPHP